MKNAIAKVGRVTSEIKTKHFAGLDFAEIRNQLEEMGLDRHMPLELRSTEIAIVTPFGVMMQIRPSDHNQLGMFGGVLNDGEEPAEGAARELCEETGIKVSGDELEFVEENSHFHEYANGDKVFFHCFQYVLKLSYKPEITTDEETAGTFMVTHTILDHQQDFIKRMLGEKNH
ncbi:MAG: NUDIX domain-containing protein [Clostridia bacterium]|nr:NUDIX domain-containing protein [Clostridia bacterium]